MLFSSLLEQLAVDLNDAAPGHEFTTWSREQLRAYLEEAVQTAFAERPDLFMETRVIKLQPCTVLQEACDCTHIRRIIGQCTKDGRIIKLLKPRKYNDRIVWNGRTCMGNPKTFELNQYAIDDKSNRLWVWPQIPGGMDVYVLVECAVIPDTFGDYDVPDELRAAVLQWALYRAKMVDGENNQSIVAVANAHKETFWQLIAVHKNREKVGEEVEDASPSQRNSVQLPA